MRFMIIVKGNKDTEAGIMPDESLLAAMADYHEELEKAGVLVDASGLQPTSKGARVKYSRGKRTWFDGPFTESKELIAGYTIITVKSREEAKQWVMRFPAPFGDGEAAEIEIRQFYEREDFGKSDAMDRFKELRDRHQPQT
jgi:hypothetical protein